MLLLFSISSTLNLLEYLLINKILTLKEALKFLLIKPLSHSSTLTYFLSSSSTLSCFVAISHDSNTLEYSSLRYLCFFLSLLYLTLAELLAPSFFFSSFFLVTLLVYFVDSLVIIVNSGGFVCTHSLVHQVKD